MVVRRDQRPTVRYPGTQATREILSPSLSGRMLLLWVTFPPGEDGREPVRHMVRNASSSYAVRSKSTSASSR